MPEEKFIKYGGVKFKSKASDHEINEFVNNLPEDKKDSLFEVVQELNTSGLIDIPNDGTFSTLGERPGKTSPDCD